MQCSIFTFVVLPLPDRCILKIINMLWEKSSQNFIISCFNFFFYGSLCRKVLLMFEYIYIYKMSPRMRCVTCGKMDTPWPCWARVSIRSEYRLVVLCQYKDVITFDTCRFIGWVNHCNVQIYMWCLYIQTLVYFAFRACAKNYNQSDVTSCIAHNLFQCRLCHLNLTVLK